MTDSSPSRSLPSIGQVIDDLDVMEKKATPCKDVAVMWYPQKDGTRHPQFETDRGGVAQEEADYDFYAALRSEWPKVSAYVKKLQALVIETQCNLITRNAELATARSESVAPGWIPVGERLPENMNNVIAYYVNAFGNGRRIRAFYAKQYQLEDDSEDGFDDAEEHNGTTYLPAGWYETNEAEEHYYRAEGEVSHWHPMPEGPKP